MPSPERPHYHIILAENYQRADRVCRGEGLNPRARNVIIITSLSNTDKLLGMQFAEEDVTTYSSGYFHGMSEAFEILRTRYRSRP